MCTAVRDLRCNFPTSEASAALPEEFSIAANCNPINGETTKGQVHNCKVGNWNVVGVRMHASRTTTHVLCLYASAAQYQNSKLVYSAL